MPSEPHNAPGTAGTYGGGWDFATVNGSISFVTGATFSVLSLGLENLAGLAVNFDGTRDAQWIVATTTGGITGADLVTLDLAGFQNPYAGPFALGASGQNLVFHYAGAAIPEPTSTAALAGAATLALVPP